MNEQASALLGPVDPALELPFRLGCLLVSPSALEISCDGSVETIERRMMQVLTVLNQRIGRTVSRDELSLLCWDGRIVSDDALNRIISRLRKALTSDVAVVIETIPKVGYRLKVEGAEAPATSSPVRLRRRWPFVAGAIGLLLLIAAAFWSGADREVQWRVDTIRPLTRDPGIEVSPALSPDGRRLAYAGGSGFGEPFDIFLRGTALGETRPVRLTRNAAAEISPAWSPDGVRLAFVRRGEDRRCSIILISPPDTTERVAGRCREAALTKIEWQDERTILYSDGPIEGPWRLFSLDVNSGRARVLTSPDPGLLGDFAPSVSPDRRQIAFRRMSLPGSDDIYLFDRQSGAARPLGVGEWKANGFAWSPDSRTLFVTSSRGGDFGLWAIDTRRANPPHRVSHGIVALGQISADRDGNLAIETVRTSINLFAFSAGTQSSALTESSGNHWDPDSAADGRLTFGSDLSGFNELWTMRPGGEPVRLTQLQGSYVYSPRWSPDGNRIAFIVARQGLRDVYVVNADGAQLSKVTDDGLNKGTVVWVSRSEVLQTRELEGRWQVTTLRAGREQRAVPGGEGLTVLRRTPDGLLFGRGKEPSVFRLKYANGRISRVATGISAPVGEAWTPSREGIYWVEAGPVAPWAIRFSPWIGRSRVVGLLQALARPSLAFRESDGAVVAPRLTEESADLHMFEARRN